MVTLPPRVVKMGRLCAKTCVQRWQVMLMTWRMFIRQNRRWRDSKKEKTKYWSRGISACSGKLNPCNPSCAKLKNQFASENENNNFPEKAGFVSPPRDIGKCINCWRLPPLPTVWSLTSGTPWTCQGISRECNLHMPSSHGVATSRRFTR